MNTEELNIVKGDIGNALHDISPNHVIGTADEIYDSVIKARQSEINQMVLSLDGSSLRFSENSDPSSIIDNISTGSNEA